MTCIKLRLYPVKSILITNLNEANMFFYIQSAEEFSLILGINENTDLWMFVETVLGFFE